MAARGPRRKTGFARGAVMLLSCALVLPGIAAADNPDFPTLWAQQAPGVTPPPAEPSTPKSVPSEDNKYLIPVYGIIGFNILLHIADRLVLGDDFDVNGST